LDKFRDCPTTDFDASGFLVDPGAAAGFTVGIDKVLLVGVPLGRWELCRSLVQVILLETAGDAFKRLCVGPRAMATGDGDGLRVKEVV